jgi:hypothetical protein
MFHPLDGSMVLRNANELYSVITNSSITKEVTNESLKSSLLSARAYDEAKTR